MINNKIHIKKVKSIRLDGEIHQLINVLKINHIDWSKLVHDEIKTILQNKVNKIKKPRIEKTPF